MTNNKNNKLITQDELTEFLFYKTEDGKIKIEVHLFNETVWLSQKGMAHLFQKTIPTINEHIKNVFQEGELEENSVIRKFRITASDGKKYLTSFYNLDVIISVGYRVKSHRGTQFRIWATQKLKEYIIKGFVLDDERLKNPDHPFDYYEELIRRIQEIRTSEKRFYRKITDVYATSVDYDPANKISIKFFQTVQNKLHWAITGKTAAEIISQRANSTKFHMGLTSWRGTKPGKDDVVIAKNYLEERELKALNNLVEQYLIYAEGQAMRRIPMYMKDWIKKLNSFLEFNERNILKHAGKISHQIAKKSAEQEYEKYKKIRQIKEDKKLSDFDNFVKKYLKKN
ncbi:virulence RhuM family protein [Patescibacteria group bacterium]|nr:virulence RhuM family protein [Patescibacteria group bacterium]MCG2702727.1 virulence RhuM family protein [Candidatus Parcubacteria bacterium]MBU4265427.1 virulence RhuM family protein [Patescibacteria group bacterium]MBU4390477.1 virulence RhuM family protein [Patescibacteria group bacterium]MBU4397044.1 virulence RhuM family protein [Patescibacteria group bacterium]